MPEGDTIHRVAARLRPALVGHEVSRIDLPRTPRPHPAPGETIEAVHARGKHLMIDFSGGSTLRVHLRMTGSWHLFRPGQRWSRPRHTARVVIVVPDWVAVCFNAPDVELTERNRAAVDHLGPDLCDPAPDIDDVVGRARRFDVAGRTIGESVMDQRIACGIGNVYKSEALFAEGVAPTVTVAQMDDDQLRAVFVRAHLQLRDNLDRPGARVTAPEGVAVYGRGGESCHRCGTRIERIVQGDSMPRSTYHCPTCQPRRHPTEDEDVATHQSQ